MTLNTDFTTKTSKKLLLSLIFHCSDSPLALKNVENSLEHYTFYMCLITCNVIDTILIILIS